VTTPQDPENRPSQQPYPQQPYPQQPYTPAPPPLSESELAASGGHQRPAVPEPKEVRLSFFLWLAGAVLLAVSALLMLGDREAALEEARNVPATPGITVEQLESTITAILVFLVIIGVVLAGLMALFAFKARAGRNWARVVLTVLGVVVFLYNLFFAPNFVGLVLLPVLAAAVVTLYLPGSKTYFDSVKRAG
jgi:type IV secretory pathway VirB2 component (pilin)